MTENLHIKENGDIELKILKDTYTFKKLHWLEELEITETGRDRQKALISRALLKVNELGLDKTDAMKLLSSFPTPIFDRIYIIYRASMGDSATFKSVNITSAPDLVQAVEKIMFEDEEKDNVLDTMFGGDETDMEIYRKSGLRGATKIG